MTRGWCELLPEKLIDRLPVPAGAVPADVVPADVVPADVVPADVVPAGLASADVAPAGLVPAGAARAGAGAMGAVRAGAGCGLAVTRVGVVIPAHDEEVLLPACLAALGAAAARAGVPVSVVVVLDACTDGTLAAVRAADPAPFGRLEHVACQARSVGAAREAGCRHLIGAGDPAGLWLATTDADSTVPPDWIVRQLAHASLGARAVIGTVQVADWSQHPPHTGPRYRRRYRARDGHRHVHGANMSMAASAYLAAGGFPAVAAEEDVAMIGRLAARGEPVVWAADLPVITSARLVGRAPAGFAGYLARLAGGP